MIKDERLDICKKIQKEVSNNIIQNNLIKNNDKINLIGIHNVNEAIDLI